MYIYLFSFVPPMLHQIVINLVYQGFFVSYFNIAFYLPLKLYIENITFLSYFLNIFLDFLRISRYNIIVLEEEIFYVYY